MNKSLVIAVLVMAAGTVGAKDHWLVKPGITVVQPKSGHSTLNVPGLGNVAATVSTDWEPSVNLEYAFNRNWSVEAIAATPFTHRVRIAGIENAARFRDLPPTISVKYRHPMPHNIVPYVGLGVNYTYIWGEQINTTVSPALAGYTGKLKAKDSVGPAVLVGAEYKVPNTHFGVALDVRWAYINSDLSYNGTKLGKLEVDPWVYTFGFTYSF